MNNHEIVKQIADRTAKAVANYWQTRAAQRKKQETGGKADQGLRSAVTGGAQMDGFIDIFTELVRQAGIPVNCIFRKKSVELPGFFRPTKEWDLLVVLERTLIGAIEAKSQVGPSFGKYFKVFPEFVGASYMRRYELFCRKLVLERHYTASAFTKVRTG
jgi:hypothetical protein